MTVMQRGRRAPLCTEGDPRHSRGSLTSMAAATDAGLDVGVVRLLRHRQAVDRLDELRLLRALSIAGASQLELARHLGISQPSINKALKRAMAVRDVLPGFSGATPFEIAQRYAAGLIDREQLVDELGRFPYVPFSAPARDGMNATVPGTAREILEALDAGLIDEDTYDAIQDRIDEQQGQS